MSAPQPSTAALATPDLIGMYRAMLLTRALDLKAWTLSLQGKAHFVITGRGHEAAQVGSAFALRRGLDFVVPYYRSLGVAVALGMTAREIMLNILARDGDPNGRGRQLCCHFSDPSKRIFSGSSVVATQIPHAVGLALSLALRGDPGIVITYFGEGATSKGDFHEALNFAGVFRLPVIFFCENNGYAISVPQHRQMAIQDVASRAAGYGFPGVVVDGNDILAVYQVTREAIARAERGEGPTLIEAKTYRLTPHSSADDDRTYRSREEVAAWEARDPIRRLREYLLSEGLLTEAEDAALQAAVREEVEEAAAFAEAAPYPPPEDALTHIYAETEAAVPGETPWRPSH